MLGLHQRSTISEGMYGRIAQYAIRGSFNHQKVDLPRETYRIRNFVGILPYDEETSEVLMVVQPRAAAIACGFGEEGVLEIVGGRYEAGEDIRKAAARELAEETGLHVDREQIQILGEFMCHPSALEEVTTLCVCHTQLSDHQPALQENGSNGEPGEPLRAVKYDKRTVKGLIADGTLIDARTIACFSIAEMKGFM